MIIPDANLLLYAYISSFHQHQAAKEWVETTLSEQHDVIGLSWQVITAFLRIGTNPRVFQIPFKTYEAVNRLNQLVAYPLVQIVIPTDKHWQIFADILVKEQITADLVMDAHLAALAIEHNAMVATTDRDFLRFGNRIKIINPLESK